MNRLDNTSLSFHYILLISRTESSLLKGFLSVCNCSLTLTTHSPGSSSTNTSTWTRTCRRSRRRRPTTHCTPCSCTRATTAAATTSSSSTPRATGRCVSFSDCIRVTRYTFFVSHVDHQYTRLYTTIYMVCFLKVVKLNKVLYSTSVLLPLRGLLSYDIENQIYSDVADTMVKAKKKVTEELRV